MPEVKCEKCPLYLAAEKFAMTSAPRRRPPSEDAYTTVGRLIAEAARARGMSVREASIAIKRTGDYLGRVCRGSLALTGPTAYAVGTLLGIELGQHVGADREQLADTLPFERSPNLERAS